MELNNLRVGEKLRCVLVQNTRTYTEGKTYEVISCFSDDNNKYYRLTTNDRKEDRIAWNQSGDFGVYGLHFRALFERIV